MIKPSIGIEIRIDYYKNHKKKNEPDFNIKYD